MSLEQIRKRDADLREAQERERLSMHGQPGVPDDEWNFASTQAELDRRWLLEYIDSQSDAAV